jgi:hypothetical protein
MNARGKMVENLLPSRRDGIWLADGRLPVRSTDPLERLLEGVERVASIRADIAATAKVRTMPPVEVVPYILIHNGGLICGRVTALGRGEEAHFGVQLPAPTVLCTDYAAVRSLLVHEFAHWFYIAMRVVNGLESGEDKDGSLDLRYDGLADTDTQIDPWNWFGAEDARSFVQHGDSATAAISNQAIGLEKHFFVVTPRMGHTAGRIDISDDVKAHIRRLGARRDRVGLG